MTKKHLFFVGLCIGALVSPLGAQQLTRFAVVDLSRVYTQFFRESRAVREWEERSSRVQNEVDRMTAEINTLHSTLVDAEARGAV